MNNTNFDYALAQAWAENATDEEIIIEDAWWRQVDREAIDLGFRGCVDHPRWSMSMHEARARGLRVPYLNIHGIGGGNYYEEVKAALASGKHPLKNE